MADPDAGRDERWFEALVTTELPTVHAYAARRVRDPDDVVSEVFATAWRHIEDVPIPARAWLIRVASNHVLHVARSERRMSALVDRVGTYLDPTSETDHAESTIARLDDQRRTQVALAMLNDKDSELLKLRTWEELSVTELATVLGCSTVAVKVRLHRARQRLAAALANTEPGGSADQHVRSSPLRTDSR